ncbi:ribonuclease-III-like-domain-containing protein [Stachybotrys elegans]|uniref:Ribonuclease-III-like-domain-containing protein n=1 Tax=Stachybotrys elegans TaxID=80388 RepID=A0A8K0SPG9_9HYPO|nr:ribonuclease-III-like-domain-containing protein [Stachybotrys elegans]
MALRPLRTRLPRIQPGLRALSRTGIRASSTEATTTKTTTTPAPFEVRERAEPRWKSTPAGMKAPTVLDFAKKPSNKIWHVNNSPERLDAMYNRLLGKDGSKMLPEELKWLAVTHKSFDQGRRGFNDRLALMGRHTLTLEATKHIVSQAPLPGARETKDAFGRKPFENKQLASVDNLSVLKPTDWVGMEALYLLAKKVDLLDVMRWKPRLPDKLESSGVQPVLNGAILAIIGALTLQHGAAVGAQIVRERILGQIPQPERAQA